MSGRYNFNVKQTVFDTIDDYASTGLTFTKRSAFEAVFGRTRYREDKRAKTYVGNLILKLEAAGVVEKAGSEPVSVNPNVPEAVVYRARRKTTGRAKVLSTFSIDELMAEIRRRG